MVILQKDIFGLKIGWYNSSQQLQLSLRIKYLLFHHREAFKPLKSRSFKIGRLQDEEKKYIWCIETTKEVFDGKQQIQSVGVGLQTWHSIVQGLFTTKRISGLGCNSWKDLRFKAVPLDKRVSLVETKFRGRVASIWKQKHIQIHHRNQNTYLWGKNCLSMYVHRSYPTIMWGRCTNYSKICGRDPKIVNDYTFIILSAHVGAPIHYRLMAIVLGYVQYFFIQFWLSEAHQRALSIEKQLSWWLRKSIIFQGSRDNCSNPSTLNHNPTFAATRKATASDLPN